MIGSLKGCINDYKVEGLNYLIIMKKAKVKWFISEKPLYNQQLLLKEVEYLDMDKE
jgi:hypothetical protein